MDSIYIKGDAGFKSTILSKLGGTWLYGFDDREEDTLRFSIPDHISHEDFKKKIGYSSVVLFNLRFFSDPPDETPKIPSRFIPGRPIKMSIWVNKDHKLNR